MTVGGDTFINDMMNRSGLENIFDNQTRYPEIFLEEILNRQCEMILLSTEPYPFTKTHVTAMQSKLGIPVILVNGEMFSWYGSRLMKAISYLENFHQKIEMIRMKNFWTIFIKKFWPKTLKFKCIVFLSISCRFAYILKKKL